MLGGGGPDAAALQKAETAFHRDAAVLDAHLGRQSYLVDGALTLADFAVAAYLHFAVAARLPWERYGNIRAWYARIEALPAWQQTKPPIEPSPLRTMRAVRTDAHFEPAGRWRDLSTAHAEDSPASRPSGIAEAQCSASAKRQMNPQPPPSSLTASMSSLRPSSTEGRRRRFPD